MAGDGERPVYELRTYQLKLGYTTVISKGFPLHCLGQAGQLQGAGQHSAARCILTWAGSILEPNIAIEDPPVVVELPRKNGDLAEGIKGPHL